MNINIKITHPSGTVMEVNIPILDSAAITMPSAPVTPEEPQVASEPDIPAVGEPMEPFLNEVAEENRVLVFKCQDGDYNLAPALYSDFCSAFGATATDRELTKARLWCETNAQNRKTRRGMGRFLNAWLCRAQGEKRTPVKGRSGSLLESANTSQQGW